MRIDLAGMCQVAFRWFDHPLCLNRLLALQCDRDCLSRPMISKEKTS